jgi:predicted site-specific integrase-resolvase
MLTPEQAAVFADVSLRTIFHWVEAGRVHYVETANANLAICLASLPMRPG